MKARKGRSQPEIAAAAFLILYIFLGSPFLCRVLIATQMTFLLAGCALHWEAAAYQRRHFWRSPPAPISQACSTWLWLKNNLYTWHQKINGTNGQNLRHTHLRLNFEPHLHFAEVQDRLLRQHFRGPAAPAEVHRALGSKGQKPSVSAAAFFQFQFEKGA